MKNRRSNMGLFLIIAGVLLTLIGLLIYFFDDIPFLGKLPGDIMGKKENFTFYFPLASSIIISIILSLIFYFIRNMGGK